MRSSQDVRFGRLESRIDSGGTNTTARVTGVII